MTSKLSSVTQPVRGWAKTLDWRKLGPRVLPLFLPLFILYFYHFLNGSGWPGQYGTASEFADKPGKDNQGIDRVPVTIKYNLTIAAAWRNPDGGRWRTVFVGNGESPAKPILEALEGDRVEVTVFNEVAVPISMLWQGIHHPHGETWHDGSAGITMWPLLPRANRTSIIETSDNWGLRYFFDHTTTISTDGAYGALWIKPAPKRRRPYSLVSSDPVDMQEMLHSEETAEHLMLYNWQHIPTAQILSLLQAEGYDPYCFQSILVNGKGRVHCKPDDLLDIDGKPVDQHGCVAQASGAVAYPSCRTSQADYHVIETKGRRWVMLNFANTGFEHPYRISIDDHDMWVVANDGGFIHPIKVQALTVTNGERFTVVVKLDKEADDYAIRIYALSRLQFIQTYAILRYPHRDIHRRLGEPMLRPSEVKSLLNLDGTIKNNVSLLDKSALKPFPPSPPPQGKADVTLHLRAAGTPDPRNPYITNCSLNGATWQLWRAFREPLSFAGPKNWTSPMPAITGLPLGSVVDIIVQNDIPAIIPLSKHNDRLFQLGSGDGPFAWKDVVDAAKHGKVNLKNPPLAVMHELPAGGWLALRWRIEQTAMTSFHAYRARYFVQGMRVAMFEGDDHWQEVPDEVKNQPSFDFEIAEDSGVFD
ncbi:multicopper oxidase [Fusarium pseudocircinatum]|uniref:Multicopper oxidase n=1 Tax=Fusarium pseudocircinatum TaxID=56676 RepID=A0A8H5P4S0_9HYPO|nr:multicopper oxidase [Fusarium pseudocircinatum]